MKTKIVIKFDENEDVSEKAKAMIAALKCIADCEETLTQNIPADDSHVSVSHTDASRAELLAAPVHTLPLKPRVRNVLMKAGYQTIGHLVPLTTDQLREVYGVGRAGVLAIERALDALHLR